MFPGVQPSDSGALPRGRNCQAMETSPPSFPVISTGTSSLRKKSQGGTGEEAVPGCPARRISPVGAAESRERVRVWTGERFPAASSVHTRRVYTPSPGRERTASEENGSAGVGTEPV